MSLAQKSGKEYTYADYLTWPEGERWEIIAGRAYNMTPAPSTNHQRILLRIASLLEREPALSSCRVFIAPTDVVLSESDVVQPDVFVVCDQKKITKENIQGIPDLVLEVLSPSTARKDRREKKALYERFGLEEYILVDPDGQYVERFRLEPNGTFSKGEVFAAQDLLSFRAFEGVEIPLRDVFEVK
jgi:Uma2 family endonuclease